METIHPPLCGRTYVLDKLGKRIVELPGNAGSQGFRRHDPRKVVSMARSKLRLTLEALLTRHAEGRFGEDLEPGRLDRSLALAADAVAAGIPRLEGGVDLFQADLELVAAHLGHRLDLEGIHARQTTDGLAARLDLLLAGGTPDEESLGGGFGV